MVWAVPVLVICFAIDIKFSNLLNGRPKAKPLMQFVASIVSLDNKSFM